MTSKNGFRTARGQSRDSYRCFFRYWESCCVTFSKNGAKVVLADIDEKGGNEVEDLINSQQQGKNAVFVKTDVANSRNVENCVRVASKEFGRVNCLFNNAGINPVGTVIDTSEELWEKESRPI